MGIISSAFFKLTLHISLWLVLASCGSGTKPTQEGSKRFEVTWESLANVNEEPDWFKDAKFGIYFHWAGSLLRNIQEEE